MHSSPSIGTSLSSPSGEELHVSLERIAVGAVLEDEFARKVNLSSVSVQRIDFLY